MTTKDRQKRLLSAMADTPDRLIHAAFRYYLGRMTIATVCFARDLAKAWPWLDENVARMIRWELVDAFKQDDATRNDPDCPYNRLGHDCDREAWELVRAAANRTEKKGV